MDTTPSPLGEGWGEVISGFFGEGVYVEGKCDGGKVISDFGLQIADLPNLPTQY